MYKAAIFKYNYENKTPTAKEVQGYLKKSGKLLYGNDKRKSKNTPFDGSIHLVMHAFSTFEAVITGRGRGFGDQHMLYIFDDQVNQTHFLLKYAAQVEVLFLINESIINEMNKFEWSFGHLMRYKKGLEGDVSFTKFMDEKNIGNAKLHKAFPKYMKAIDAYTSKIDDAMSEIEAKSIALFTSGW